MQRPDEQKRREIMRAAATMFAERPYHEVRLDDIAAATRLGKGTLYVYFASKDDLFTTLIAEGIDQLIVELRATDVGRGDTWPTIGRVVGSLLRFADRFPHLYTLMRSGAPPQGRLANKRRKLANAIARILRRGARAGEIDDPHPELTAEFVLNCVRGALLTRPGGLGDRAVANHILRVLGRGILVRKKR